MKSSLYLACLDSLLFLQGIDNRLPWPAQGESTHPVYGVRAGLSLCHFSYELFPVVLYPTHFNPENGGSIFFWSTGIYIKDCTVSQPRISQSELSLLKPVHIFSFSHFLASFSPSSSSSSRLCFSLFLFPNVFSQIIPGSTVQNKIIWTENSKYLSRIFFIKLLHVYFHFSIIQLPFRAVLTQSNMENFCNTGRFPFTPTFLLCGLVVFREPWPPSLHVRLSHLNSLLL